MGSVCPAYAALADLCDSDDEATVPEAADSMSHLDAALQLVGEVPRGTLADAWQPCQQLKFEGPLPSNEDTLKAKAESTQQSRGSDDANIILNNLKKWRGKYLDGERNRAQRNQMELYKDTVEALRAKAYLLYQKEKSEQWGQNTRVSCSWVEGAREAEAEGAGVCSQQRAQQLCLINSTEQDVLTFRVQ
jgi:hypothetical protein